MEELRAAGIKLRNYNIGDHKAKCPNCENNRKPQNKHDEPLSVTIEADGGAVWNCHNCGHSGGIAGERFRRDNPPAQPEYRRPKEPAKKSTPDKMLEWFKGRGISKRTVEAFKIYRTERSYGEKPLPVIAFPYHRDGELINVKYRTADKKFQQEAKAERTLYNIDAVKARWAVSTVTNNGGGTYYASLNPQDYVEDGHPKKTVIFVEGEIDVLTLWECGIQNAVSLPDGAPKEAKFDADDKRFRALGATEWLNEADKVIIATDTDEPGNALALELAHRFGKDRCWRVQWPDLNDSPTKDANEALEHHGKESVVEAINLATPYPIDGVYVIEDYTKEVLDIFRGKVAKPLSTGFPVLDQIYQIMPGTFHVVTGIPNHGKSAFVDQIAVNLARNEGWRFAVFSPEHSVANHIRRLAEKIAEKPFDVGPTPRMNEDELRVALEFLSKHFFFLESRETVPNIDWILTKARAACVRHGIKGLIIDPYNEIDPTREKGQREDEHIRGMISACKQFNRRHNTATWMVAHPSKMRRLDNGKIPVPSMYDISGAAHWHNMADAGVVIHRDFETEETRVITRKIREQGLYGSIGEASFRYNVTKRVFEETLTEAARPYTEAD